MSENTTGSIDNGVIENAPVNMGTMTQTPANPSPVTPAGSAWSGLAPLILMLIAFYFLLIRPQQKRENKRREMINAVKRGDRVITAGGIIGTVHKIIDEREISLEISENVRMRILKNAITEVLKNSSDPVTKTDTEPEEKKTDSKVSHVKNLKGNAKSSKATGKK